MKYRPTIIHWMVLLSIIALIATVRIYLWQYHFWIFGSSQFILDADCIRFNPDDYGIAVLFLLPHLTLLAAVRAEDGLRSGLLAGQALVTGYLAFVACAEFWT